MAERSRTYGMFICATSALAALIFLMGVLRKSYMALALPVTAGFLGALRGGGHHTLIAAAVEQHPAASGNQ